jgi:3-hydroxyisobutyrate dehydrogenase-like beta-hydroxyacid dehydrogenase
LLQDPGASPLLPPAFMTIGILGLGLIGSIWARHYHAAGALTGVWNRTPQPEFPNWKTDPAAVAAGSDVVQIVVADPPAVRDLISRILPALGPGKIVVQSSTIDPGSSQEFEALVVGRGARYLEAPFTGSKPAAEQRQTVYYLGGDRGLITELEPLLSLVSSHRFVIGNASQAASLKLAMNLNIAAQMEALSEALTLSRRAGISDDVFFEALGKNASYSGLTKLKEPKAAGG